MINPNIHKRVKALVQPATRIDPENSFYTNQQASIDGQLYDINYRHDDKVKQPGSRYLYINYSICNDHYYLTVA